MNPNYELKGSIILETVLKFNFVGIDWIGLQKSARK
jgi:hypothetical protein